MRSAFYTIETISPTSVTLKKISENWNKTDIEQPLIKITITKEVLLVFNTIDCVLLEI